MVKDKFIRHTIAFLALSLASALLYFAAQAGSNSAIWILQGLCSLAAILVLTTR